MWIFLLWSSICTNTYTALVTVWMHLDGNIPKPQIWRRVAAHVYLCDIYSNKRNNKNKNHWQSIRILPNNGIRIPIS